MSKLTKTKVDAIKAPGRYADGGGLYLVVQPQGSKSWVLRKQVHGQRRDIGLGSVNSVSLASAREAAMAASKELAAGIDTVAERRRQRAAVTTFRGAAQTCHHEKRDGWRNPKHSAQWLTTLETYAFPHIGDIPVEQIDGPLIIETLRPIWLAKPEMARRLRQRICAVLNWCHAKGLRSTEAPSGSISHGLPKQPTNDNHFAAMAYEQVPAFVAELRAKGASAGRTALELAILTGARSGEIRHALWSEIDLESGIWSVPANKMKGNRAHSFPLSRQAITLLQSMKAFPSPSGYVFPGYRGKALSDNTMLKMLRDMGQKATTHGFRSSFRDWVSEKTEGFEDVAEAQLAHKDTNRVRAAYRRTSFDEKRRVLMQMWADYCDLPPAIPARAA